MVSLNLEDIKSALSDACMHAQDMARHALSSPQNAAKTAATLTAGYVAYRSFRFWFVDRPGHPAPPPGSMYLAFGSWTKFPDCYDPKTDPFFYDIDHEPWKKPIEENWTVIRDELKAYLERNDGMLAPFGHSHRMSSKNCWRVLSIKLWNILDPRATREFPKTLELLTKYVGEDRLMGVTFSQLEANSDLARHLGDTNAAYRVHLGLIVPAKLPHAGLEVGGVKRSWEEGKLMAFNDAHWHMAWNHCDKHRYICIIDVMRKEHMRYRHEVCSTVMGSFLLQKMANRWAFLKSSVRMEILTQTFFKWLVSLSLHTGCFREAIHNMLRG